MRNTNQKTTTDFQAPTAPQPNEGQTASGCGETQNSNGRESAAQMLRRLTKIEEAKKNLYEAVTAINRAWEEALTECRAVREGTPEEKLEAISKAEYINRARDCTEEAIGFLNKADGTYIFGVK